MHWACQQGDNVLEVYRGTEPATFIQQFNILEGTPMNKHVLEIRLAPDMLHDSVVYLDRKALVSWGARILEADADPMVEKSTVLRLTEVEQEFDFYSVYYHDSAEDNEAHIVGDAQTDQECRLMVPHAVLAAIFKACADKRLHFKSSDDLQAIVQKVEATLKTAFAHDFDQRIEFEAA